jgi:superfamily II DNA or RNA helicase
MSTRLELLVPALFSRDVVVEKNRARQLLIPQQRVATLESNGQLFFKLSDGRRCRITRTRRGLRTGELAFLVPKNHELADGDDLDNFDALWLCDRTPTDPTRVVDSLAGAFTFLEGDVIGDQPGLRSPQIGAVHAVLGYWTTDPTQPATVVMPTGTGKTETMLALFAERRIERLLVIVPSDALRSQLAAKFESFGVLQEAGVVSRKALRPVVGQVRHNFSSTTVVEDFVSACNVVIATPQALSASSPDVQIAFLKAFSHLFVDEAHHVAASTWRALRDGFGKKPVVQFTATPFREDGKHLGGRLIYAFPLREAQRQNYFSVINYISVVEFDDPDRAIAVRAVEQLRADLAAGRDHLLMARVMRIGRADDVLRIYEELAHDLAPVIIHSNSPAGARKEAIDAVRNRRSRIIVCVDMLGEGFDLPALKIAAIHDPHKSLGVTLQFIGRFARVTDSTIGNASVVVGRPELDYDDNLRRLYSEDADWNYLIRDLSQQAVGGQEEESEFEAGFAMLPEEVSIHSLLPKMSTVVYRTSCADWNPGAVGGLVPEERMFTPIAINAAEHFVWFIIENHNEVPWGDVRTIQETSYDLFVLYWDSDRGLLYLNSSNTDSVHEELAKTVCGDDTHRVKGESVYRVMAEVQRLVPTNVGVLDVRNRARRFSMHVGADVSEGFPEVEAQTKTKTNIFAYGFEEGARVSVGASMKGRVWSYRVATSLKEWMDWCDSIGTKLTNNEISIDRVMEHFIRPQVVESRPPLAVLGLEWPWEIFLSTTEEVRVEQNGSTWPLVDAELRLLSFEGNGPVEFRLMTPEWGADYEASFTTSNIEYRARGTEVNIVSRRAINPLSAFLNKHGLTMFFEKDAIVVHPGILLQPQRDIPPFDPQRLEVIDWSGIDLRKESQGAARAQDSIQARAIDHLLKMNDWDLVVDDDGCGEIADVVAMKATGEELIIHLLHCKYSSETTPGARLADLYEVCGQAQKSARWRRNVDQMFRHLIRRERKRAKRSGRSGVVLGSGNKLYELEDKSRFLRPTVTIAIVQPGVSKAKVSSQQLELLASTELYLLETALAKLQVYCSA